MHKFKSSTVIKRMSVVSIATVLTLVLVAQFTIHTTSAASAISLDVLTSKNQTSGSTGITSNSFSTTQPNEQIVAFISADGPKATGSQTVTAVTGGGLTWSLRQRTNTQYGDSEIWQAIASAKLSNTSVQTTFSKSTLSSVTIASFSGADTAANGAVAGANAASGAQAVNLTATRNGSWTWGVGNDWDNAVARTVGPSQTKVAEYLASSGDTHWTQRQTTASGTAGSVSTLNDTAPTADSWNYAAIEILPAGTATPPDTTPPVISAVDATAIGQSAATINWTTDEPADTQVEYGTTASYGTVTIPNTSLSTGHSATLNGLAASTIYHYHVKSKDASGNLATSPDATFTTTAPAADTTAPTTAITSPAASATVSATVSVTASASDNVGVAGVQFKLDGANLGAEVTASPYTVAWNTTSATNGAHQLTATARDAAGNTTQSAVISVTVSNTVAGTTAFTVNGATTYQTMTGLGASINSHSWNNGALKPALDMMIDQNGTKTFRVVMEMEDWEGTNDNSDPSVFNWDYYNPIYSGATSYDTTLYGSNFGDLWNTIDYLHQKGIPDSQIELGFMGNGPTWNGGTSISAAQEDEWVETVLSAAYYGYTHGHTFGIFAPDNEEDFGRNEGVSMTAAVYAEAMNKLAIRMDTVGMNNVRLIGPSVAQITQTAYADAMANYPALMAKLDHMDYHNYSGQIGSTVTNAISHGKDQWMGEFSNYDQLDAYVYGGTSGLMMWDGYDSIYNHAVLNNHGTTAPNDVGDVLPWIAYNANTQTYTPRKGFYEFGQFFKYLPLGSVRIAASQSKGDAYAFQDPVSKRVTIIGENDATTATNYSFTLSNLAPIPSMQSMTTSLNDDTANMTPGVTVTLTNNTFTYTVAAGTIFTLTYAPATETVPPTSPTNLTAQGSVGKATLNWTASTDNVGVTGYTVYRSTVAGFTPSASTKIGSTTTATTFTDTAASGTYYYQVVANDAAGNSSPSSNEASTVITSDTTPPTVPTNLAITNNDGQSVALSWSAASDDVAVSGYRVYRNGTLLGSTNAVTYSDTSIQPATAYSYNVVAVDGAGNVSAASNTVSATTPSRTIAINAQVLAHPTAASNTVTSPGLTTTVANTLLVATLAGDGGTGATSYSKLTTPGLTWTLQKRVNAQPGTAEIWTAFATTTLTNAITTATRTSGSYTGYLTVTAFSGASSTVGAVGGASGTTGAPTTSITATRAGSLVWAVGDNWDAAASVTVGANQTKVDEYQPAVADTFWVQKTNSLSTAAGQVITINDTSPTSYRWDLAAIEILPQ